MAKHASQTDAAKGFGGKYGVQSERKDKVFAYCVVLIAKCIIIVCNCNLSRML